MIFGAPLVSQRLGLLPPHLQPQQPPPLLPPVPSSAPPPSPLDSSLSSLTQPVRVRGLFIRFLHAERTLVSRWSLMFCHPTRQISSDAALGLLDDSYHSVGGGVQQFHQYHHRRRSSQQRISISLGSVPLHGAPHDPVDIFTSLAAAASSVGTTPTTTVTATITEQEAPDTRGEESVVMVLVGREAKGQEVHGAGLLLRPSAGEGEGEEQYYFSSDDEMEGEGEGEKASSMHVVAAAAGGARAARRRRRGTTADFLLIEEEEVEEALAMDTAGATNRIVLPAFKAAKTSAGGRPRSLPNLLLAAKQEGHSDGGATAAAAVAVEKRQPGLERVLAAEEPGAPLAMQRSLSASDVMSRPPNLRIIPPPPPTAFHRSVSHLQHQRGARQQSSTGGGGGAVGPRGIEPPVIRPR